MRLTVPGLALIFWATAFGQDAPDPGHVTARRLNRYEYNATIRDLLGIDFKPADDFPADDFAYGFDNIGDVLSLSPALMEKYLAAAKKIASAAIDIPPTPKTPVVDHRKNLSEQWPFTWSRRFTWEGDYQIRFAVPYFVDGRHDPGTIYISIDGAAPQTFPLATEYGNEGRYQDVKVHVTAGVHQLKGWAERDDTAVMALEMKKPKPASKPDGRQPYIESVEVRGPWNPKPSSRPDAYSRVTDLKDLARRAWRRPTTSAESAKLLSFVGNARKQGATADDALKVGVMAVLLSPNFLFRMEHSGATRLNGYELASRLSYFLWSSMPDEELLRLAEQNKLADPLVLAKQVHRMLKDEKANAIVDNFGGQWLLVRNLDSINPDPKKFPQFNGALRASMKEETRLFFSNIVREDRSIVDFLTAKYTFVNEPLAKLYGIAGVTGNDFRKVDLTGTTRMGIVTQGSVLTVSSYATRTSPVLRGKWILENLLNAAPPPPPPDVPALEASGGDATGSLRMQMEKHRNNIVCASCHSQMDPLGFGLENFDAIGQWRTTDGKFPIDSKGTLPDGRTFSTPEELMGVLAGDKEAFAACLTEKLMTFALGRGLESYDKPVIKDIVRRASEKDYRFSSLIMEIVSSAPFQMKRAKS